MKGSLRVSVENITAEMEAVSIDTVDGWGELCRTVLLMDTLVVDTELENN